MLKGVLKVAGKSLLIVTGVSYGVIRALDALGPDFGRSSPATAPPPPSAPPVASASETSGSVGGNSALNSTIQRLDRLEERLARIEAGLEILAAPLERPSARFSRNGENYVTRTELEAALERLSGTLDSDIERRFDVQNRSVQALRTMIARTDELLEQVLESIEATISA